MHVRLSNEEPFYIGKGVANRATSKHGRSQHWHNIVNKDGYKIIYLYENLSPQEAIDLEMLWIDRFGRKDLGKGTLVNLTDGGDGITGRKMLSRYGEDNFFFGCKHTEGTKEAIRHSNRTRVYSKESQLKKVKNSLIKTSYGDIHFKSKLVLNKETGVFHLSIREAANTYGLNEGTLRLKLNNTRLNNTSLIYI